MPMLDAYIPPGALSPEAERELIATLTDVLIRNEGADPSNVTVRQLAWVTVHYPQCVYVAGRPAEKPRYRFVASVPQGQFTPKRRAAIIKQITDAVLDAEGGAYDLDADRIWVLTPEIPEGTWGAGGRVVTLAEIVGRALGDVEAGRKYAEAALSLREPVGAKF